MSIHTWVGKMPLPTDVTTLRLCLLRLGSSRRDGSSSSSSAAAAASLGDPNVFFLPWHTSTFGKGDQQPFFPFLPSAPFVFSVPVRLQTLPYMYLTLPDFRLLGSPFLAAVQGKVHGCEREREEIPSQFQNTFSQQQQYTRWDTGLGLLLDEFLPKPRNGQESCMTKPPTS